MALSLTPETFWHSLSGSGVWCPDRQRFPGGGFGQAARLQEMATHRASHIAFGNGISVNLLQLARAYTVFANDGDLKPVTLLKQDTPTIGKKVFSQTTVQQVRDMMELVVQPAEPRPWHRSTDTGWRGKTGTAHKVEAGITSIAMSLRWSVWRRRLTRA